MPKKKVEKKSKSKSKSKEIAIPWRDQLKKMATSGKAAVEKPVTSNKISMTGGKFSLGGNKIGLDQKGRELEVIILAFSFHHINFDHEYVKGEYKPPGCFSIGYEEDGMHPHEDSPNKRSKLCAECPMNEYETAEKGKGKHCTEKRRLAVVFQPQDGKTDVCLLELAPTTLSNWKGFLAKIGDMGLETMQVLVRLTFDEDSSQPIPPLEFEIIEEITNEKQLNVMAAVLPEAHRLIETPIDCSAYKKPTGDKSKGGKSVTPKKKRKSKFAA